MAGIVYGNICATYGLDIPNTYTYTQYQMPKMANQGQGPVGLLVHPADIVNRRLQLSCSNFSRQEQHKEGAQENSSTSGRAATVTSTPSFSFLQALVFSVHWFTLLTSDSCWAHQCFSFNKIGLSEVSLHNTNLSGGCSALYITNSQRKIA